jgi:energy-coupling factor transport system permease protein
MGAAIQFIPTLYEEAENIRLASISRGCELNDKNIFKRLYGGCRLIIPVFLTAFKRADELSVAMQVRSIEL